jgi:hypothetical protein
MNFREEYATQAEAAEELACTVRTLARWRAERIGPPYTKVGARVYYRRAAVAEWVRKHETAPVREAA